MLMTRSLTNAAALACRARPKARCDERDRPARAPCPRHRAACSAREAHRAPSRAAREDGAAEARETREVVLVLETGGGAASGFDRSLARNFPRENGSSRKLSAADPQGILSPP